MRLFFGVLLLWALGAAGQTSEEVTEAPAEKTKVLAPLRADVRGTFDTDIILAYVSFGVQADLGLVKIGPGVLALGAGLDIGFCGSPCVLIGALRGGSLGHRDFFPQGRLSYHLELPAAGQAALQKIDVYGVLFGGVVFSNMGFEATLEGWKVTATSSSIGPGIGLGAGGNYFLTERLFIGAEATVKYAQGTYKDVTVVEPPGSNLNFRWKDEHSKWSLTGVGVRFFLGFRI